MKFSDIKPLIQNPSHGPLICWPDLLFWAEREIEKMNLNLDPDFQRIHVWDEEKSRKYVEYKLRGGDFASTLYFNHPYPKKVIRGKYNEYVIVDGKQRLTAAMMFLRNELTAFGHYYNEYEDKDFLRLRGVYFRIIINDLKTRAEVLRWYLDINTGGVVHSPEEIEKVKKLLAQEEK